MSTDMESKIHSFINPEKSYQNGWEMYEVQALSANSFYVVQTRSARPLALFELYSSYIQMGPTLSCPLYFFGPP